MKLPENLPQDAKQKLSVGDGEVEAADKPADFGFVEWRRALIPLFG